ncbi:MAG TPA: HAD family hydrolase [Polyangia bacterium]|jgi:phosphoglycolate phosphatase
MTDDRRAALVIFDLDGTLLDTLGDLAFAMDTLLDRHGCPRRRVDDYRAFIGDGVGELVRRSLPPERADEAGAMVAEFRQIYLEHMFDRTAPYAGVPELLDALTARGVPLAVLSNKLDTATRTLVDRLLGRWRFAAVVGEVPHMPRKPDPTAARAMAAQLGVAPARTVFVGDSGNDVETAARAGMLPVGVLWGFRDRDELEARGARVIIARPAELLPVVEQLPDW